MRLFLHNNLNNENLVKFLLQETEADIHARNNEGSTALMIACENIWENGIRILLEAGANPSDRVN